MTEVTHDEVITLEAAASTAESANSSGTRILRNVAMSYVSTGAAMLAGVFVQPVLIRVLGKEQYGLWTLLLGAMSYLGLIDLGIGTAVAKRVADCQATGDRARLGRVLGTALVLYLGLAAVLMTVTLAILPALGHFFTLPPGMITAARLALVILSANQAFVFIYGVQASVLYGGGRLDLLTSASVVSNLAAAGLNVWLVLTGHGVVALAAVQAGSTLFLGLTTTVLNARYFPAARLRPSLATWAMARELVHAGARNAGLSLSAAVAYGADTFIIACWLPLGYVTVYTVGAKLVNVLKNIAIKPIGMLLPALAHCDTLGDHPRQFRLFTRGVSLSLGLALPVVMVMFVLGDRLIRAWAGPGHDDSFPVLILFAAALPIQLQGFAAFTLVTATERNQRLLQYASGSAIANLALSWIFTWQFGVIGPALGSMVCVLVVDGYLIPRHACAQLGCSTLDFLRASILPLLLPCALSALLLRVARGYLPDGLPWLLAVSALSGLLFLFAWRPALFLGEGTLRSRVRDVVSFA